MRFFMALFLSTSSQFCRPSRERTISNLFCRLPLAADGRDDGAFFFQFGKGFVDILAVSVQDFGHVTCGDGFPGFAHGFQYLFFHIFLD